MKQDILFLTNYSLAAASGEAEWAEDLRLARDSGMTHILLEEGGGTGCVQAYLDNPARMTRALDLCDSLGLKVVLSVFELGITLIPGSEKYLAVDRFGQPTRHPVFHSGMLNLYRQDFRDQFYFPLLEKLIGRYKDHPAVGMYIFIEAARYFDIVSYGPEDCERYRRWLRARYGGTGAVEESWGREIASWEEIEPPRVLAYWTREWEDWTLARREWLAEWARETAAFIRRLDSHLARPLVHLEGYWDLDPRFGGPATFGGLSPESEEPFDIFLCEMQFRPQLMGMEKTLQEIEKAIALMKAVAPGKRLGYTTRTVEYNLETRYATAAEIIALAERALELGVACLNYCSFRHSWPPLPDEPCLYNHRNVLEEIAKFNWALRGTVVDRSRAIPHPKS